MNNTSRDIINAILVAVAIILSMGIMYNLVCKDWYPVILYSFFFVLDVALIDYKL